MSESNPRVLEALFKVEAMSVDMAEIKGVLREMATAIQRLAVIEERQTQANAAIGRAFSELDKHGSRIDVLEKAQPLQQQTSAWVHKAVTVVITAVITAVLGLVLVKVNLPATVPTFVSPK